MLAFLADVGVVKGAIARSADERHPTPSEQYVKGVASTIWTYLVGSTISFPVCQVLLPSGIPERGHVPSTWFKDNLQIPGTVSVY